jgi:copper transport protein
MVATDTRARWWRRALLVVPVLLVALFAGAPAASAHAVLESSDPQSGVTLTVAPAEVNLRFSEPVELAVGGLRVLGPDGGRVDLGESRHGTGGDATVKVGLRGGLGVGTYTVSYRVVSADSHPISGAYTFHIGRPSGGATPADLAAGGSAAVERLESAARGLAFLGFAVMSGAVLFALVARPEAVTRTRVWVLLFGSWAALLVSTVAVLALHGPYAGGLGLSSAFDADVLRDTLRTKLGRALAVRVLLLGAAGALLGWLVAVLADASRRTRAVLGGVWAALCAGLAATWAVADHASVGRQVPLALTADIVHLLAMGAWLGGLAMLVTLLVRPGADDGPGDADADGVACFSRVAFWSVLALVATGLYAAWRQVGSFDALFGTKFGLLLVVKVDLVLLMIACAVIARRWLRARLAGRRPGWPLLRRVVAAEAALAIGVLGVTTVLVDTEPARTAHARERAAVAGPASESVPFDAGGANGRGIVNVTLDPARTGSNDLHVYLTDPIGTLRDVPEVTATFSLPGRVDGIQVLLGYAGPGHWQAVGVQLPLPGTWDLALGVRTSDFDRANVTVRLEVR